MNHADQMIEVEKNYDFFQRNLARFLTDHAGTYALLRHADVIGFYPTVREAINAATDRFPDQIYSLQEVTAEPIDLGVFSHAGS